MDLGLKGKTVIVTGGGSNIGRGICLGFAQEGHLLKSSAPLREAMESRLS